MQNNTGQDSRYTREAAHLDTAALCKYLYNRRFAMQQNRQPARIAGLLLLGIVILMVGCAREIPDAATEPVATEPVATEPVATEPVATEPVATEPVATEPAATEPAATEPAELAGTSWMLESIGMPDDPQPVLEDSEITLLFDEQDGTLAGNAGCNQYQGSYERDGDQLNVGALISTRMACAEPEGVMLQEREYLDALQSAESYQVQGEQLTITYANDSILRFRAFDAPAETIAP
jgi:heat shock protein HslJ